MLLFEKETPKCCTGIRLLTRLFKAVAVRGVEAGSALHVERRCSSAVLEINGHSFDSIRFDSIRFDSIRGCIIAIVRFDRSGFSI